MGIIDEEGRLFGVVNVVDAAVVLFVLVSVAAGAAFVLQPEPGPEQASDSPALSTVNVTLDVGPQPAYVVAAIDEGDTYVPASNARITVTDVHLVPRDGRPRVVLDARLEGPAVNDRIRYVNAPPRLGRNLTLRTASYRVHGTVRAVGSDGRPGATETTVVLRTTLPASAARSLADERVARVAGRRVATVDRVVGYEADRPGQRHVYVEATVDGVDPAIPSALRHGANVSLPTAATTVSGRVVRVGSGLDTGPTEVLVTGTVPSETAATIERGDRYRVAGRTVGTVRSVAVYGTHRPGHERVAVGLSLSTVRYDGVERFGATAVREGATVPFRTGAYGFRGEVRRVGATEPLGTPATRTVTLRLRNLPPAVAERVRVGATERGGGETLARVTDVRRRNATVVVVDGGGNVYARDHPVNRTLTVTAELRVRETPTEVRFKRRALRTGRPVTLDLGSVTVNATVASL